MNAVRPCGRWPGFSRSTRSRCATSMLSVTSTGSCWSGPTHPLRLLWFAGWGGVGGTWRKELAEHTKEAAADAAASFFDRLDPLGFPFAVPRQDNRALLAAVGNLTPFWTALVHPRTDDAVGLLNKLAAALGVPDAPRSAGGNGQAPAVLAERVERYVRQHSYVRTLVVNVINPGDAGLIAEMLLDLQRRSATKELTYDLRLCTPNTAMPGIGEALAELTRSDSRFNSDEADAFGARGGSSVPKLAYSIRSMEEFEERPGEFEAHLTIFVDAFSGEEHETGPLQEIANPPAYGLIQQATHRLRGQRRRHQRHLAQDPCLRPPRLRRWPR